jgi:MinD-like ATPase involved in chromosome partitioning or flagellar assembly
LRSPNTRGRRGNHADQISRLLEQLSEQFQYVVVDTAPGLPEIGLAAMEKCTDVVCVSGMDMPSVRGLRPGLDILRQLDITPDTRHVALNMADSRPLSRSAVSDSGSSTSRMTQGFHRIP